MDAGYSPATSETPPFESTLVVSRVLIRCQSERGGLSNAARSQAAQLSLSTAIAVNSAKPALPFSVLQDIAIVVGVENV